MPLGGNPKECCWPTAGSYAVGLHTSSSNCYGVTESFEFGFNLNNSGDSVYVSNSNLVVDKTTYTSATVTEGASTQLDSGTTDATSNDSEDNWCVSTTMIGSQGDAGSPGSANASCP